MKETCTYCGSPVTGRNHCPICGQPDYDEMYGRRAWLREGRWLARQKMELDLAPRFEPSFVSTTVQGIASDFRIPASAPRSADDLHGVAVTQGRPWASKEACVECKDTGVIHKKYRKQPSAPDVHPAVAAGAAAYRTIVTLPCPSCKERARKMKGTILFVLTRIEKGEIKEMHIITDGDEVAPACKAAVKKAKLRAFAEDLFYDNVPTLRVGQSFTVGDFNGTEISVRRLKVE